METYEVVKKLPVFATILDDYQSLNEKLIRVIDDHQKLNAEGLKQGTNVDAWRTDYYTKNDTNDFDFLIDKIIPFIYNVNQDYFNDHHTFYDCQNFWAMKYSEVIVHINIITILQTFLVFITLVLLIKVLLFFLRTN